MFPLLSSKPRPNPCPQPPKRRDDRIVIHFDYDCFYAACFEVERPELRRLPLAVRQKQIIVTCNYEARRRGLYKLQLLAAAKRLCPDVVVVPGEDLGRFRDRSRALYEFLGGFAWSGRAERLGFDEVWLDVTDMVEHNVRLLNPHALASSWFCLDRGDPTRGFAFDAGTVAGETYPRGNAVAAEGDGLGLRLALGSHLASFLRTRLEDEKGFTATAGISTNKVLSKLVGSVNKPRGQTTLATPYADSPSGDWDGSNVRTFLDDHEISKIPGIGSRSAQPLRKLVLGRRDATHDDEGPVTVRDVRTCAGMGPELLEGMLGGPGAAKGVGGKVWSLLHGVDDSEVGRARKVPMQISIEDTYLGLHDLGAVRAQLILLATSLVRRMRVDLTDDDNDNDELDREEASYGGSVQTASAPSRRWLAHARTVRLSTCERTPTRSSSRISRSGPMPAYVFGLRESPRNVAERLTQEVLLPIFAKLIPAASGFNVNLINVAAMNMLETAGKGTNAGGRDIGKMFKAQGKTLDAWRVDDASAETNAVEGGREGHDKEKYGEAVGGSEDELVSSPVGNTSVEGDDGWDSDGEGETGLGEPCPVCGALMLRFALEAHLRFHLEPD